MEVQPPKKNEKRNKFSHILAGLVILLHGYEKLDTGHIASAIFFLVSGIIFLMIAVFHHKLVNHFKPVDAIFWFIEAVLAAIVSIDYFNEHKHYIQYAYILVATGYFIKSFILFKKAPVHEVEH
jgi:uncharacterized membrane protein